MIQLQMYYSKTKVKRNIHLNFWIIIVFPHICQKMCVLLWCMTESVHYRLQPVDGDKHYVLWVGCSVGALLC